jgi:maleylacetoacetate isomerase
VKLFTYWRSQASYRVRIALALKRLDAELITLDLLKGDQFAEAYRALNPEMVVPTLVDGEHPPLSQSLAILEFLDEQHPDPPLLPKDLYARARVRALAQVVAMDAHPFIVPRVRKYLEEELAIGEAARAAWIRHWLDAGSRAIEQTLAQDARTGVFCVGDQVTIADICLAAHLTSAKLFGGRDPAAYPVAGRIYARCMAIEAFANEHPLRQPDAPQP